MALVEEDHETVAVPDQFNSFSVEAIRDNLKLLTVFQVGMV